MPLPLKQFKPTSRAAWRAWLERQHESSSGIWLVFAKKHTKLPTLTYEEAVQEALCFGWIDSLARSIDDRFHMLMFTPRKAKSAWSATNKARVATLMKGDRMTPAGRAAIALAKKTGTWDTWTEADALTVPPELQRALDANADAKRHWPGYTESARKSFLYMLSGAKRPETREKRIARIVDLVARNVSMTALRKAAMTGKPIEASASAPSVRVKARSAGAKVRPKTAR